ncbi:MAG TPA: DUF4340 domain-containing protein [Bryobacteraceae bacterium]|nr:DUF4340 domain-containing protein [Bryobacteraceae bacterium]
MRFRGLLVAVVLLAILGGAVYWSNKREGAAGEKKADTSVKILSIPADQIREVRLAKAGSETTVLRKADSGQWEIVAPKPLRADQETVNSMVSTLSSLSADKVVEEKAADLAAYGLDKPGIDVTVLKKDGKTDQFLIGDEIPTGSGNYAKTAHDARVFTIAGYTKSSFEKSANDLRDRRLLTFDSEKLTRLNVLAGGQDIEFGKDAQNDWAILKPRTLRADGSQVEELIRKLKDAKMEAAASDDEAKQAAGAFASGTRVALVTVSDQGGNQQLEIRRDKDKNYYAKSSVVEGFHKVANDLGEGVDKKLDDFRNRKLFGFGWSEPSKVEVRTAGGTVTYAKSGEKWMSGQKQMDPGSVQNLIDKLRDLNAAAFLETGGTGELAIEITVTSNDGKRVEKVTVTKNGGKYYAKREGEPSIYELDAKTVEELEKSAREVKEFQPPKKK